MPDRRKNVGLMVESLHGYGPRILNGLTRWVHSNPGWRITFFDGERHELADLVREWEGDGIVCTITDEDFLSAARSRDIPVINLSGRYEEHFRSSVVSDDLSCGAIAADYFIDRGFEDFAFIGGNEASFAKKRAQGFIGRVEGYKRKVEVFENPLGKERELAEWLKGLPLPTAIFCPSDRRASSVLEACYLANLRVPEDIAVLGIGDHIQLCELCTPPLSSVDCDMEQRGYEAAALLDRMMTGAEAPEKPLLIPPKRVATRRSTDTYAFQDEDLIKALRFIHENAHQSIKVNDVVKATSISRRSLENRFRKHFRHSLHDAIWGEHFDLAKHLLTSTDLGLKEIAELSGFRSASGLANLFKQKTGQTARTYRAENRR